jgi:hypothetical protein
MNYRTKSNASFRTRKRFFIFNCIIKGIQSFTDPDFMNFKIDNELVKLYATEYFQFYSDDKLKNFNCPLTINEIYCKMMDFEKEHANRFKNLEGRYFNEIFPVIFPLDKFELLGKKEKCYYCDITLEEVELLVEKGQIFKKSERGWHFEIDRKKPNLEYSVDNCEVACYWCNNAKTDEFDDEEFSPIGRKIGDVLRARLNK